MGRPAFAPGILGPALLGEALAGLVGGTFGQLIFLATSGGASWEATSRILGWTVLGALIGVAMSLFIPNLRWHRGLLGGVLGGSFGALAFLLVSMGVGSVPGRLLGAAVVGFCIGLMIALVELAFRRYWLEIAFGPREVRTLTLGASPVSLGSDQRLASVYVPDCAPVALVYRVMGGRVFCDDPTRGQSSEVAACDRQSLGRFSVTLCSPGQSRAGAPGLRLSTGETHALSNGLPLTAENIPGLQAQQADGVVALVSSRPGQANALMLRNRSRSAWRVTMPDGSVQTIEAGLGVVLQPGIRISFGATEGWLEVGK